MVRNCTELDYERIFQNNYKEMFYFTYNLTKDYFLAEDIIQEVFVKIYLKFPTLNNSENLRSWTYKILKNTTIDQLRKKKNGRTLFQ